MKINTSRQWVRERTKTSVSCCRCWLLSCETRHDVQSAAERREHPAGLQGGQEEPGYSRYSTAPNVPARCRCWELSFLLVDLFFFFFSWADVSASHSVLHQLRALHLLRSHLRLQLRQHQQGGVRPHLLFLRQRVQSAGLRQVCAAPTHSRSVAFTQNVRRHSWTTAFQMLPSFTEVTQSAGGQMYTGPHSDWNPSVLTLRSVVYNYLMVCCYRSLMTPWSSIRLCTVRVSNLQSFCVQAEH